LADSRIKPPKKSSFTPESPSFKSLRKRQKVNGLVEVFTTELPGLPQESLMAYRIRPRLRLAVT